MPRPCRSPSSSRRRSRAISPTGSCRRRKLPYTVLSCCLFLFWAALALTAGALPLWGVALILFGMGAVGGAFVLTWPIGREVNPPHLAGTAVAVANMGGFLGAALTQKYVGRVLDAGWTGVDGRGRARLSRGGLRGRFQGLRGVRADRGGG